MQGALWGGGEEGAKLSKIDSLRRRLSLTQLFLGFAGKNWIVNLLTSFLLFCGVSLRYLTLLRQIGFIDAPDTRSKPSKCV